MLVIALDWSSKDNWSKEMCFDLSPWHSGCDPKCWACMAHIAS